MFHVVEITARRSVGFTRKISPTCPPVFGEFIAHNSKTRFGSLNHEAITDLNMI
jgi:hypothetical protein